MKEKFVINDMVVYHPEQHRLTPLGSRGKETALNVPASRCLLLMLQRPGVNITQEEFFSEVWEKNGQYVTPNTFYQNISLIRKGIRNAGLRNQVIRTLPKVGLCFTGTVQVIGDEDDKPVLSTQIPMEEASADLEEVKVEHLSNQANNPSVLGKLTSPPPLPFFAIQS
ncbi:MULTISPECIES: winged helix-turn-helix domain-containing protein [unclassified Serratia (in: enterobacteria)]|uniref:winged helix-turn-helix domain-containing protein n=1 Tax=unclassified Serratia (in: enterobacteria) TaxID=2647522 RepID=UPI003076623E